MLLRLLGAQGLQQVINTMNSDESVEVRKLAALLLTKMLHGNA